MSLWSRFRHRNDLRDWHVLRLAARKGLSWAEVEPGLRSEFEQLLKESRHLWK